MFGGSYRGKRILVTGATGFKGSWLCEWLDLLGAAVTGFSLDVPTSPSMFEACGLHQRINQHIGDVRDSDALALVFREASPEIVFHLAAQPLVSLAYQDPKLTFDTNVGGTVNVLETIRQHPSVRAAVMITSDKCYHNLEWPWGYRETDELGGNDPYGASKAAAELACRAYAHLLEPQAYGKLATVRAGNVIGGGDWANGRVVPDLVQAWAAGREAVLRKASATRPWQHVLEPLSGYLTVGQALLRGDLHGEAFNFGPSDALPRSVSDLTSALAERWGSARWRTDPITSPLPENTLLRLSSEKAYHRLGWRATLGFDETVQFTVDWYRGFYGRKDEMHKTTRAQIETYSALAQARGLPWAGKAIA